MQRIETIGELRDILRAWRDDGAGVALVPTMGNLHKGHMKLVNLAGEHAERVVVSIFVNPTQFGPQEDFGRYPRTPDVDARKLARAGVDVLFEPTVEEMYPHGPEHSVTVQVPGLSDELEGASRPGHFAGVASVVTRLFNVCAPDVAVFGQKDYQQLTILKRMVSDLHIPVRIIAAPTERAGNGLALSSRNQFLDDAEREQAGAIYKALCAGRDTLAGGSRDYAAIEAQGMQALSAAGLEPDYFAVRAARDLSLPDPARMNLVILAAARLGAVRLIDNVLVAL